MPQSMRTDKRAKAALIRSLTHKKYVVDPIFARKSI